MQSSRISIVLSLAAVTFVAVNAIAGEFPAPNLPEVFAKGDFGVVLAMDRVDDATALEAIAGVAARFPWSGGFPPTLTGDLPTDLPDVVYENVDLSGDSANDLSGEVGVLGGIGALTVVPVPEPAPALLLTLGLVVMGVVRRRHSA